MTPWVFALPAAAGPNHDASTAYHEIVSYLRSLPEETWTDIEGRGVLLAEAVLADRFVLGSRSTTFVASLGLASIDARARRVSSLAALGIDVSVDAEALGDEIAKPRCNFLSLDTGLRQSAHRKAGALGRRIPNDLEDALSLAALFAAGIDESDATYGDAVQDVLLGLLELQIPDGSWPPYRYEYLGYFISDTPARMFTTAVVVRALTPYRNVTFSAPYAQAATNLGIDTNVGRAIDDGAAFLVDADYTGNPVARAMSLLAYLGGALAVSHPAVAPARDQLVAMAQASGYSFGDSPLAAALAAQALAKAACR